MSSRIRFISDPHIGHKCIMEFGRRKQGSLSEMHDKMVADWNSVVRKKKDITYILGDVCMDINYLPILDLLNGQKRLVLGNHDVFDYEEYKKYFQKIYHFHKDYGGIVLSHIPIHPNELVYRSWKYNLHGHIHSPEANNLGPKYLNVNMDIVGYKPISLEEVRARFNFNSVPGNLYRPEW